MQTRAPHEASGAVFGNRGPWSLPLRYGDATAVADEYRALREGAGLVELSERALLSVSGPLRHKFLHGLLSNDVAALSAGDGCDAALLDVKGHVLAILRVVAAPEEIVLELPAEQLERVEALLTHYRVGAPVRFAARAAALLLLAGPEAEGLLRAETDGPLPEVVGAHVTRRVAGTAARVVRSRDLPNSFVLHLDADAAADAWHALAGAGARPVGREALDAHRIEAGRPWYGFDITQDNLLHETGLLRELHSSSKGCYVGQEVVARLEARGGRVNKALRGLRLEAPALPGTRLRSGDRDIGWLTTCGISPRFGPVALGYVHREHFEPGSVLDSDAGAASVTALPLPEAQA